MKNKLLVHLLLGFLSLSFCLISCDSRDDDRKVDEPIGDNARTKSVQRNSVRFPNVDSTTSGKLAKQQAVPAQSTDECIAEWAWNMMEACPDLVGKSIRELSAESPQKQDLIRAYALSLLARSPEEAITWANSLGDQASILAAREEIAMALPTEEIDRAVKLQLDPVRIARQGWDNSSACLLERWVGHESQAAARWVLGLGPGEARDAGLSTLCSQWLESDPASALGWLESQPSTVLRQEISHLMAQSLMETEESLRAQVLESATPDLRQQLEQQIAAILPPPIQPQETKSQEPAEQEIEDDDEAEEYGNEHIEK